MSIYLDYNATAPLYPQAIEAIQETLAFPANASSAHDQGRRAKMMLEDARKVVADAVSVWPNEVIFTASGTEANNMALRGFLDRPLLVGATEHPSVLRLADRLGGDRLPVDNNGLIDLDVMEAKLKAVGKPALLSIMLVNNETGVIQPIAKIAEVARQYDAIFHCDAAQALGKIPVDMGVLGVDLLTLCAHKMGGPVGVGALVVRNDLAIKPLVFGGGQELGRRAGTENLPAIVGFAAAIEANGQSNWQPQVGQWLDEVENALQQAAPDMSLVGQDASRVDNTSCIIMPGVNSETQLMTFDLQGLCVSAGSACSSGRIESSSVLRAMGYSEEQAGCAIRVSLGWNSQQADAQAFADAWLHIYQRLVQSRRA